MADKKFRPTPQQQAFIDALLDRSAGHLCLRARAGTGKTSTIIMGVSAYADAHPGDEIIVCAYNKAIADEVKERLLKLGLGEWGQDPRTGRKIPPPVQAATAHSLGLSTIRWLLKPEIDDKKVRKIVDGLRDASNSDEGRRVYEHYGQQVIALVRMAKQAGFGFFADFAIGDNAAWHRLAAHYDINGLDDTSEADAVVEAAQRVYRMSLDQTSVVDFDDMILFPLVKNVRVKYTKDLVIVDEAQDLSRARQALIRKFLSPRGRMIIVGDDRQAIYGFSGADAAALENLVEGLGATTLPLSITWRCPRRVVELARQVVPDIEAAPTVIDGEIIHLTQARTPPPVNGAAQPPIPWYADPEAPAQLDAESAVLCRNTAPLVSLAYQLIRAGKPCKVEGRAIGDGLKALAQRWRVKTVDALLKRLAAYAERERQKALAKSNESKAEEVEDRVATLREICGAVTARGLHGVSDVLDFIDDLFADGAEGVTVLATAHRSKGREWKRVFLFEYSTRCPSRAARQPWQIEQERNLMYVMLTRAQETLVFVN